MSEMAEFDLATRPRVEHRSVKTGGRDDWPTPVSLLTALREEFGLFDLDAAACWDTAVAPLYYGPDQANPRWRDALVLDWGADWPEWETKWTVFLNPPHSLVAQFVAKAAEQYERWPGMTIVMLLPARTDTRWFHQFLWDRERYCPRPGVQVRFLKGRLTFMGAEHPAPFPSMVVVLNRQHDGE